MPTPTPPLREIRNLATPNGPPAPRARLAAIRRIATRALLEIRVRHAAPDLLAVCKVSLSYLEAGLRPAQTPQAGGLVIQLRRAIVKAGG